MLPRTFKYGISEFIPFVFTRQNIVLHRNDQRMIGYQRIRYTFIPPSFRGACSHFQWVVAESVEAPTTTVFLFRNRLFFLEMQ